MAVAFLERYECVICINFEPGALRTILFLDQQSWIVIVIQRIEWDADFVLIPLWIQQCFGNKSKWEGE